VQEKEILMFRSKKHLFFLFITVYLCSFLYSAEINVPSMEIISHGAYDEERDYVVLQTDGEMKMSIEGGFKFGAIVKLGFDSDDIERDIATGNAALSFKSAEITIREVIGPLLSLSFFIGENDILCSGRGFTDYFGTSLINTNYSGFMYFPESQVYEGIHTIYGTGISATFRPIPECIILNAYAYQDSNFIDGTGEFIPGIYSCELRSLFNLDPVKIDFFIGATGPAAEAGYYRAGLLFYAKAGPGEFITQVGLPRWDPVDDTFGMELFYLLFEVNLSLGIFTMTPTVFLHPGFYQQHATSEEGVMDINLNFTFGDVSKHFISGGFDGNFSFTRDMIEGLVIKVFPFISFVTPGVLWKLKCGITLFDDPMPYDNTDTMFEGFIGIKAEF
jgi:hypothetical protein